MEQSLYVIKNVINNKCYVGQTNKYPFDRVYEHIQNSTREKNNSLIARAIRKYGSESFIVVETLHCQKEQANKWEETLILYYDALIPNGYNILPFGQVFEIPGGWWKGRKRSPETVAKIAAILAVKYQGQGNPFYGKTHRSESLTKMSHTTKEQWRAMSEIEKQEAIKQIKDQQKQYLINETEEQKIARYAKISKANTGKIPTLEATEKNRQTHLGKTHTEETKAKMSAAKKGKLKSKETRSNMTKAQHARRTPEQIERILNIRKMLSEGMSGIDIAKRIGCTPEYVYKVRKGERGKGI